MSHVRVRCVSVVGPCLKAFVTFKDVEGAELALHSDMQVFGVLIKDDVQDGKAAKAGAEKMLGRLCHIQPGSNFKSIFIRNLPYSTDSREMVEMIRFLLPPDFPVCPSSSRPATYLHGSD